MKTYVGTIINGEHDVHIATYGDNTSPRPRLNPRYDLANHSPDGFCWGYGGSGPAQLALAILADHLDAARAMALYQEFKFTVIARLDMNAGFALTVHQVNAAVRVIDERRARSERNWMVIDELRIAVREGCNCIDAPTLMPAGSSISEDEAAGTTFAERDDQPSEPAITALQPNDEWSAVREGYEPGALVGWGRTREDAIMDLADKEADQ